MQVRFLNPEDEVRVVGRVFDTPLVVKGSTWLPLVELVLWGFTAWLAGKRRPERSLLTRLGVGFLMVPALIGMEWLHNFSHAAAAQLIGRPMDALRILWGTPVCVYHDPRPEDVTPRQHIARALGGPICNALLVLPTWLLHRRTAPDSPLRDITNAALGMNIFTCTVAMLPIPGIDGGPVLKWSLVETGRTPEQADRTVRAVNGGMGAAALVGALGFWRLGRRVLGGVLGFFGLHLFAIALGIVRAD
jgi:Zn-dependent protease